MSSRPISIGDIAIIRYQNVNFTTRIIKIDGSILICQDVSNGAFSSLTWSGTEWLLPQNIKPDSVAIHYETPISSSTQSIQLTQPAKAVCIKADYLRPQYDNLEEWMNAPNNVYTGRYGRIFITENDKRRVFHHPASKWANPFTVKEYSLEESIRLYKEHLVKSGLISQIHELKGKNLGCFCDQSDQCHAQILAALANSN